MDKKYRREYNKKYRENNREKFREYSKKYYQKNKDKYSKEERLKRVEYLKQYNIRNKDKKKEYDKEYRRKNREKLLEQRLEWTKKNPHYSNNWTKKNPERKKEIKFISKLKCKYNLTINEFNRLLEIQANKCGICEKVMKYPCVDHDHKTGKVRGILCNNCNKGLGFLLDSRRNLFNAIAYLDKLP